MIANGVNPWIDESEILLGMDISARVTHGISISQRYLLIATPESLASSAVQLEIELAHARQAVDPTFQFIVYKHADVDLRDVHSRDLTKFLYVDSKSNSPFLNNPLPAIAQLVESITGKNMLVAFLNQAFAAAVQKGGVTSNLHSNDYLFEAIGALLMQIKGFIQAVSLGHFPEETLDSLQKMMKYSPLAQVVNLQPRWVVVGPGLFETLHANCMRIPPHINIENLPDGVSYKVTYNDEVRTQIQFIETLNGKPYLGVLPFRVIFETDL